MKKIILTGGGTAGHVTPNIALLPKLKELGYEILYVGSRNGIEKTLIEKEGIPYREISAGKLRRYIDLKNLSDPFRVIRGFDEACRIMKTYRPDVVFSKGGYVSVPVVLAAELFRIPVVSHESDMTPGLANKITMHAVRKICCNFPETLSALPKGKGAVTGCPIRKELFEGDRERGLSLCGFNGGKPVILVIGGSLGAVHVNTAVRNVLPDLLKEFDVIHICGKNNVSGDLEGTAGYCQFDYVNEDLKDLFAAADLFISRAGANAICEIAALAKPNILIPLGLDASRGDQILNARSFEKQGFSKVLMEEDITGKTLVMQVEKLWEEKELYIAAMKKSSLSDGVANVCALIESCKK